MARLLGNAAYFEALQEEMERTGTTKEDAELALLHRVIVGLRTKERLSHTAICAQLKEHWGFNRNSYWRRLAWIRKKYACH